MAEANTTTTLLTLDNCRGIVAKYNAENSTELIIKSYEITPATEARGFLGEYFRLLIKCYRTAEELKLSEERAIDPTVLKFFVKSLGTADDPEKVKIFRKESAFYGSLLPELQKHSPTPWSPKVYMYHTNPLVLEDLDSLGYSSLTSRDTLTENEMLTTLRGLASMHASSLLYEKQNQNCIETSFSDCLKEITIHPDVPWYTTGTKALLDVAKQISKYQAAVTQQFIRNELPMSFRKLYFIVNPSTKYRNVLCHRDTWGGNIFIKPNDYEKSAIFVDFQTCRYCPPAIDIIYTLFMNLTKAERLAKQEEYIKYYYGQLQNYIRNNIPAGSSMEGIIFSEVELMESIKEFQLFGLVYRALAVTILNVPREMVTDAYKHENRSEKLLDYMQQNEEFRLLMEEAIEDLIDAVVNETIKSNCPPLEEE